MIFDTGAAGGAGLHFPDARGGSGVTQVTISNGRKENACFES